MRKFNRIVATLTVLTAGLTSGLTFGLTSGLPAFAASATPGYQNLKLEVAHRDWPLDLHIWYPAQDDGNAVQLGKKRVFTGHRVAIGATPVAGPHPLIVLSHGLGGNAVSLGWIASHLAGRGMIVVATNHHGTTSRDTFPEQTLKVWQRPADLSAILDHFEKTRPKGISADMTRVGAVGFSLGGFTVLSAAGARVSKNLYIDYCDRFPEMWDCAWFRSSGIDLGKAIKDKFEQSNLDRRIKAVVAIDPGLAQAFVAESLTTIATPVRVINLGARKNVPAAIDGFDIAASLPNSDHFDVAGATHYSFLGVCTPEGEALIRQEGEEPICTGTGMRSRADIHRELEPLIAAFLSDRL